MDHHILTTTSTNCYTYTVEVVDGFNQSKQSSFSIESIVPIENTSKNSQLELSDIMITVPLLTGSSPKVGQLVQLYRDVDCLNYSEGCIFVVSMIEAKSSLKIVGLTGLYAGTEVNILERDQLLLVKIPGVEELEVDPANMLGVGRFVQLADNYSDIYNGYRHLEIDQMVPGSIGVILCCGKGGKCTNRDPSYFRGVIVAGSNKGKLFCMSRRALKPYSNSDAVPSLDKVLDSLNSTDYRLLTRLFQEMLTFSPVVC